MAEKPYYEEGGTKVPRVSRILSILREPQVEAWKSRTPDAEEQGAEARRIGTHVHAYIAADLTRTKWKPPATLSMPARNAIRAYEAWKQERMPEGALVVEHTYVNHGYGGTVDLVVDNHLVIDWKIAGAIRPKHWIQTHAYVPLVWPEQPIHKQVQIVRLDKDLGIYEAPEPRLFSVGIWETFCKLRDVYAAWYFPTDVKEAT